MRRQSPRGRRGGIALVVAMSLAFAAASPVAADGVQTITIIANGNGGVNIAVPPNATLTPQDINLVLEEGSFAFAALAAHGCDQQYAPLCVTHYVRAFSAPGWDFGDIPPGQVDTAITTQGGGFIGTDYDIYLVTDGAARLVLRFDEGVGGDLVLPAAQPINAVLERLGPDCPQGGECDLVGYGHATHSVKRPALVAVTAMAYHVGPGYRALSRCIDPLIGDAPPSATDTTLGCPTRPDEGQGWETHAANLVIGAKADAVGNLREGATLNHEANGPVRVGYTASAYGATASGHAGYGIWISGGLGAGR